MSGRPTTGKRSATSGSFTNRKVAPATSAVYVHSFRDDDQKVGRSFTYNAQSSFFVLL